MTTAGETPEQAELIEHRVPTPATIKQLYGTAFRCGAPACQKPLYRVSDETGEYILNSRVAHIHARSENGPRWSAEMSEDDNRDASNLIPLCEQHAWEIDATASHFPADLLREWKAAQLAEYQQLQKSWTPTDDEVDEIRQVSFTAKAHGAAAASAHAVAAAARAVGTLSATARKLRRGPAAAATTWRSRRAATAASLVAWDRDGERLYAEPSRMETDQLRQGLLDELTAVRDALEPLQHAVSGELLAVIATDSKIAPWADWIENAAAQVVEASSKWPMPGYCEDDDELEAALENLRAAMIALSAAWRGEPAQEPPVAQDPAGPRQEDSVAQAVREHRELLDSARPWSRVDHRPFDADLYAALVEAATFALAFPELPSFLPIGLTTTTRLAAKVARNADEPTYATLINDAASVQPLAIAVELLSALQIVADKADRDELAAVAQNRAAQLLAEADWTDLHTWTDNSPHTRRLLGRSASLATPESVSSRISTALDQNGDLLPSVLEAMASWQENRDFFDGSKLLGVSQTIDDIAPWFPLARIAAEIRDRLPDIEPSRDDEDDRYQDATQNFAAHVLRIHAKRSQNTEQADVPSMTSPPSDEIRL